MMCIRNHTFGYSFRYMANILMTMAHRFEAEKSPAVHTELRGIFDRDFYAAVLFSVCCLRMAIPAE